MSAASFTAGQGPEWLNTVVAALGRGQPLKLIIFVAMIVFFAFFYVAMHFLVWLLLDQSLRWSAITEDLVERPFITLGFTALLLLTAMALTSTNGMRRRLGRRWQQLHYAAYAVGVLGVWHYWWQVKQDIREPLVYALILALLLGFRAWQRLRPARRRAPARQRAPARPRAPARNPQAADSV